MRRDQLRLNDDGMVGNVRNTFLSLLCLFVALLRLRLNWRKKENEERTI